MACNHYDIQCNTLYNGNIVLKYSGIYMYDYISTTLDDFSRLRLIFHSNHGKKNKAHTSIYLAFLHAAILYVV